MPIIILQLSDFHIRKTTDLVLERVDSIARAIRAEALAPSGCFVAVPGDIAFSGKPEEYSIAENFFRELLNQLDQCFPGIRTEIVFVPGNHDCDLALATDIRTLDLIRPVLANVDVEGALAGHCLAVQKHFFNFASGFGQTQRASLEQLVTRREFVTARSARVAFTLYNTSWLSQNPEKPSTLFFPLAVVPTAQDATADVEITVFHHPYNWLEPRNALEFQRAIERQSDIVLSGHEHVSDLYSKQRGPGTVHFIAGQAMFDAREPDNGFNLIVIDLQRSNGG